MVKIVSLWFSKLPNAAHFTFVSKWKSEVEQAGDSVQKKLAALMHEFDTLWELERQNLMWVRKSDYTEKIAIADKRLDAALSGLKAQVNAARHSLNVSVAESAERLAIMLRNYGSVSEKPYQQELGDVRAILDNLYGNYAQDVGQTNCGEWLAELQSAYDAFNTLYDERNAQAVQKPAKNFSEVRKEIEAVYRQMVEIVNANSVVNTSPEFAVFINAINPEIERLNADFRHAKRSIASCQPAPIPQQQYTGSYVTPIPQVLYVTPHGTIKLELGKDFNISYKNNIEVGNADCIIRGKGAYSGSKTVTFIIAR